MKGYFEFFILSESLEKNDIRNLRLCLLANGRVAYFGEREEASTFFKGINYECPLKYNPSDYFIEVLATKHKNENNMQKIRVIIKQNNFPLNKYFKMNKIKWKQKAICDSFDKSSCFEKVTNQLRSVNREKNYNLRSDDVKMKK